HYRAVIKRLTTKSPRLPALGLAGHQEGLREERKTYRRTGCNHIRCVVERSARGLRKMSPEISLES
ncbi:MAG: hypothetical protein ACYTEQ_27100, partial [Planctomycetota bacterium]